MIGTGSVPAEMPWVLLLISQQSPNTFTLERLAFAAEEQLGDVEAPQSSPGLRLVLGWLILGRRQKDFRSLIFPLLSS